MDREKAGLTVFFEGPFWVGVFERIEDGKLSACRVVFGSEPKDYEVWSFVLKNYYSLRFSPAVEAAVKDGRINPKRRQREAGRQTMQAGIGTKSQQALQLQREERKTERRQAGREQREARKERLFELKQQKRKEKHRGQIGFLRFRNSSINGHQSKMAGAFSMERGVFMYPVSGAFLQAVQENTRKYYWTGKITTKAGAEYPFGYEDIVKGSGYITAQCCGSTEIELGTVYAAEMGITLFSQIDR